MDDPRNSIEHAESNSPRFAFGETAPLLPSTKAFEGRLREGHGVIVSEKRAQPTEIASSLRSSQ